MEVSFSLNLYDRYGDVWDRCILVYMEGDREIIRLKDVHELDGLIAGLKKCRDEIVEDSPE